MLYEYQFLMTQNQMAELLEITKEDETISSMMVTFDKETYKAKSLVVMIVRTALSIPYRIARYLSTQRICLL